MIKRLIILVSILLSLGNALTFPVDIDKCVKIGKTIVITGWFSEVRFYGQHKALDIPLPEGSPIYAPELCQVRTVWSEDAKYDSKFNSWRSGYGNFVYIDVYEVTETALGKVKTLKYSYFIAHMKIPNVVKGQIVSEGEIIGYVGSTGVVNSAGQPMKASHIHFERRAPNGEKLNCTTEFGKLVKKYFNSTDKYAFYMNNGNVVESKNN